MLSQPFGNHAFILALATASRRGKQNLNQTREGSDNDLLIKKDRK